MEANSRTLQKQGVPQVLRLQKSRKILLGITYPLKLVVKGSLVTSAKTAAVLYWGHMLNHRRLRCNGR